MVIDPPGESADERAERLHLQRLLTESEQRMAAVPALEARLEELERQLVGARAQTAAAHQRVQELETDLTRRREEMTELMNSASWRLTRPLRRVQQILR